MKNPISSSAKALFSATLMAITGLAFTTACDHDGASETQARVMDVPAGQLGTNDVSVLWPLPKNAADVNNMLRLDSATTAGTRKMLLPRSMFDTVLSLGQGGATGSASFAPALVYSNWRIVSFRYDPCFPRVTSANCTQELRLVAQPIEVVGTAVIAHDFAIHLVYRPNVSNTTLSKKLLDLRTTSPLETGRFPLGEHPGLFQDRSKPVADRTYTRRWKEFLTSTLNDSNLAQTAFLGSDDSVTKWAFWIGTVSGGQVNGSVISPGGMDFGVHESFEPLKKGLASLDQPLRDLSRTFVQNDTTAPFFSTLSGERVFTPEQIINAALRIENPAIHVQGSTDCVSCHTATTSRLATQEKMKIANPGLAASFFNDRSRFPGLFAAPVGSDTRRDDTINNTGTLTNLRMFGFFHTTAAVSQRTINESAAVADFATRKFLGVAPATPTPTPTRSPAPTPTARPDLAVFCPTGATFDASLGFCMQGDNAIGPFTEGMTKRCEAEGGAAACRTLVPFSIEGRTFGVQRWGRAFAKSIRGTSDCPPGAARSATHGGFCLETVTMPDGATVTNAFGPFTKTLVDKCFANGGGDACFFGRWGAGFLKSLL